MTVQRGGFAYRRVQCKQHSDLVYAEHGALLQSTLSSVWRVGALLFWQLFTAVPHGTGLAFCPATLLAVSRSCTRLCSAACAVPVCWLQVSTVLQPLMTADPPPTYFKTDMFTTCFQVRVVLLVTAFGWVCSVDVQLMACSCLSVCCSTTLMSRGRRIRLLPCVYRWLSCKLWDVFLSVLRLRSFATRHFN